MTRFGKAHVWATVASAVALALPLFAKPALAETFHEEVEFAAVHDCTGETVEGDTKVRVTFTTTENSDGTTTVHTKQHTVGSQLRGVISNDKYTFNNSEDVEETFTILGSFGSIKFKTIFVHSTEDVAFEEEPGKDDFHQKFNATFAPLLPPVVTKDTAECK